MFRPMFWKTVKITLGIITTLIVCYLLLLVLAVGWLDGWLVKYGWIVGASLGGLVIVGVQIFREAWREFRKDLADAKRLNAQPDPRAENAKLN